MVVTVIDDWRYSLSYSLVFLFKTMLPLGSIVPFLAVQQGIPETSFSSIYTCKSLGNLIGALLFTLLKSAKMVPPSHTICIVGIISQMVFMTIFILAKNLQLMGLSIFLFSVAAKFSIIVVNICIIMTLSGDKQETWLPMSHSMFSAGFVLGPLWVRFAGKQAFFWVMAFQAPTLLFYVFYPSPILQETHTEKRIEDEKMYNASNKLMWLMASSISLLLGIESLIGAWINTYAVQSGVSTKEQATLFPSIFWILATVSRFFIAAIGIKLSYKIFFFILSQFITGIICSILAFNHHLEQALYCGICLFGILLSPLYPLMLSVSKDYQTRFTSDQMATVMVVTSVSDIIFAPSVGLLMTVDINFFFYYLTVIEGIMLMVCWIYVVSLSYESQQAITTLVEEGDTQD